VTEREPGTALRKVLADATGRDLGESGNAFGPPLAALSAVADPRELRNETTSESAAVAMGLLRSTSAKSWLHNDVRTYVRSPPLFASEYGL
jgi:hypothetical protein